MFDENPVIQMKALRRLHVRMYHAPAQRMRELLRLAGAPKGLLARCEEIVDTCSVCREWMKRPHHAVHSAHVVEEFNHTLQIDLMFIDLGPVLHEGALSHDTAAVFLDRHEISLMLRPKGQHTNQVERHHATVKGVYHRMRSQAAQEGLLIPGTELLDEAFMVKNMMVSVHGVTPYTAVFGRQPPLLREIKSPAIADESEGPVDARHINRIRELALSALVEESAQRRVQMAMKHQTRPARRRRWRGPGVVAATDRVHADGVLDIRWQSRIIPCQTRDVRHALQPSLLAAPSHFWASHAPPWLRLRDFVESMSKQTITLGLRWRLEQWQLAPLNQTHPEILKAALWIGVCQVRLSGIVTVQLVQGLAKISLDHDQYDHLFLVSWNPLKRSDPQYFECPAHVKQVLQIGQLIGEEWPLCASIVWLCHSALAEDDQPDSDECLRTLQRVASSSSTGTSWESPQSQGQVNDQDTGEPEVEIFHDATSDISFAPEKSTCMLRPWKSMGPNDHIAWSDHWCVCNGKSQAEYFLLAPDYGMGQAECFLLAPDDPLELYLPRSMALAVDDEETYRTLSEEPSSAWVIFSYPVSRSRAANPSQMKMIVKDLHTLDEDEVAQNGKAVLEAQVEELKRWISQQSFMRIPISECKNLLRVRWVYTWKKIEGTRQIKARLTVKGFQDRQFHSPHADFASFASTASRTSQRIVCLAAAQNQLRLSSLDVSQAFLKGLTFKELAEATKKPLRKVQFIPDQTTTTALRRCPGYEHFNPQEEALELLRPGFGLNDSPAAWNLRLSMVLCGPKLGLRAATADPSLFSKHDPQTGALVCCGTTHVDDLKIAANPTYTKLIQDVLMEEFKGVKTEFDSFTHTGVQHVQHQDFSITMSQTKYIDQLRLLPLEES
eukprot:2696642-Amphidinium_carterae.1